VLNTQTTDNLAGTDMRTAMHHKNYVLLVIYMSHQSIFSRQQNSAFGQLHAGILLGLLFNPEDRGNIFLPKRRLTFNGIHGILSQELKLFVLFTDCKCTSEEIDKK
jgi:hypothetical protein